MSRAIGCTVCLLLVLRVAGAQEPLAEPPLPEVEASPPAAASEWEPVPPPVKPTDAQNSICLLLESAARSHGLPVEFFARVIWQESRFRADAIGPVTRSGQRARGIAQFMPGTAVWRGLVDPLDPIQSLRKSADYLRELRTQFGQLGLAAAISTMTGHGTRCGMRPACSAVALALARHSSIGEPVTMRT